jgi:hypothetical protein
MVMTASDSLNDSVRDVQELEQFLYEFIGALTERQLKPGEDVTRLVDQLGLKLPRGLTGAPITWAGCEQLPDTADHDLENTLVLVRPGKPDAVGLTIGCITIRGRRYCLECGFWYCRIVIRF